MGTHHISQFQAGSEYFTLLRTPHTISQMPAQTIPRYDSPHQFEPLLPHERFLTPLLEKASDLVRAATSLASALPPSSDMRVLLRAMNSFYTNKLEGEHTRPHEVERALQQDFSSDAEVARKQRLALAHIQAEERCEAALDDSARQAEPVRALYSAERLCWLHRQLFEGLDARDLTLADGSQLVPGQFRARQVAVGRHVPPLASSLGRFIERWSEVYGSVRRGELSLVAAAASHHRLAWVHPFVDGNGRVARLHTHLLLHALGLTRGLWSPLRAFARTEDRYKALLQAADEHRQGDLDGRGNLTEQGLIAWIDYTLDACIDQVLFMREQLDLGGMQDRILAALTFDAHTSGTGVRMEALRPLHYLFATQGELGRADFKLMTGLGERTATELVSALLRSGYLVTDSAYGRLRFAVPRHALRFYFPNLWPEAERDTQMQQPTAAHPPGMEEGRGVYRVKPLAARRRSPRQ
jgi:Fic family protein